MTGEGFTTRLIHQGGRALYAGESFDAAAGQVIAAANKPMAASRSADAGTMSWMGTEAVRRAAMKSRKLVCGISRSVRPPASCAELARDVQAAVTLMECFRFPLSGKARWRRISPIFDETKICEYMLFQVN